jgi:hypothetical protein
VAVTNQHVDRFLINGDMDERFLIGAITKGDCFLRGYLPTHAAVQVIHGRSTHIDAGLIRYAALTLLETLFARAGNQGNDFLRFHDIPHILAGEDPRNILNRFPAGDDPGIGEPSVHPDQGVDQSGEMLL